MMPRRLWASAGLLLLAGSLVVACLVAIAAFPRGLSVLACLVVAALAAWYGVRRRGFPRAALGVVAVAFALGAVALLVFQGSLVGNLVVIAAFVAALACVRAAFRVHAALPAADPPARPVLLYNPRSGDGKAERFKLADEARRRGIEPVELRLGDDLEQLARDAVQRGADGLAMAGGDGSQAIVAMIAAEHDLPYACIPAGTRNHFALDLGVDREDVVGALDAFVDGGERRVDLAEVNGRVFVNNVSLGLYAEAVQRAGYREAKIRTLLNTVPDVLGPEAQPPNLTWTEGAARHSGAAVLVSNNAYRLGHAIDNATRPRLDQGRLGITAIGDSDQNSARHRGGALTWHQWRSRRFELDSPGPVPAGIDGEATMLDPPLRFRSRPNALRVRIAPNHAGASPSALEPDTASGTIVALVRLAVRGRLDPPGGERDRLA